jgi:hypothetical protein
MAYRPKAFREDPEWAIVLVGDDAVRTAVQQLLDEMAVRGVEIG